MKTPFRTIFFAIFFMSSIDAGSNGIVGYWKTKKLDSQFGKMIVTYTFNQDSTFRMNANFTDGWMMKMGGSGSYVVDSDKITLTIREQSLGGIVGDMEAIDHLEILPYRFERKFLVIKTSDGDHKLRKVDRLDYDPKSLPKFAGILDINIFYFKSTKDSASLDFEIKESAEIQNIRRLVGKKALHTDGVRAGTEPYWVIYIKFKRSDLRVIYVDEHQIMGIKAEKSLLYEHLKLNYAN